MIKMILSIQKTILTSLIVRKNMNFERRRDSIRKLTREKYKERKVSPSFLVTLNRILEHSQVSGQWRDAGDQEWRIFELINLVGSTKI